MLTRPIPQRGVSLIEIMIGLTIVAFLLLLAVPAYRTWMQNVQIRNAAESISNGLQLARSQAVRTNANVQFVLTETEPGAANVSSVAALATGRNWMVRTLLPTAAGMTYVFVEGKPRSDGAANATVASTLACFEFTPLGRLNSTPSAPCVAPAPVSTANGNIVIDIDNSVTSGKQNNRPMRVLVSLAGQILMCDPAIGPVGNPQFCPAS